MPHLKVEKIKGISFVKQKDQAKQPKSTTTKHHLGLNPRNTIDHGLLKKLLQREHIRIFKAITVAQKGYDST